MLTRILFILKQKARKIIVQLGYFSKPDFLIVGAQKSGTSALFNILKQHSKISGSIRKEIHFFDNDKNFPCSDFSAYHLYFPFSHKVPKGNLIFEATPSYLFKPKVAERIFEYNQDIKIIICLRNPVARALSAWTMFHYGFKKHKKYSHLYDERAFSVAIEEELRDLKNGIYNSPKPPYLQTGIYHTQIQRYFDLFLRKNILILEHSDLNNEHDQTIKEICDFLNLPDEKLPQLRMNTSLKDNKNEYVAQLEILSEFYKPHNELLYKLIGKKYNW